jgi:hypothetical protein
MDGPQLEQGVKRIVVVGGLGLFGRTIVEELHVLGISTLIAARRGAADIQVDANDAVSIRTSLSAGDIVIDAAGPFRKRSMALLEAAIEIGFDLVDMNDDLGYAEQVLALERSIARAGIRVLSSASTVSAVAAAIVHQSKLKTPVRVSGFLAPASRHTANRGSALSLMQSVGRPVRVLRDGRLHTLRGWGQMRRFSMPAPVGPVCGRLFESADAVYLPRIWPSLVEIETYVDLNTPGLNALLGLAARYPRFRRLLEAQVSLGTWMARSMGSTAGGVGYEIEDASGEVVRCAIVSAKNSFITAVAPALMATKALADGRFQSTGLVLPNRHVDPPELLAYLRSSCQITSD